MVLDSTATLEFSVDSGSAVEFTAFGVNDSGSAITPVFASGASNGTTPVAIVEAPASSNFRTIKSVLIRNGDSAPRTVTVRVDVSGTDREHRSTSLLPGETLEYDGARWRKCDAAGVEYARDAAPSVGNAGLVHDFLKIGTASEAVGVRYAFLKDSGLPGAWVPGSPGINGWWVDASNPSNAANPAGASQAGCNVLPNPVGSWNLTGIGVGVSVPNLVSVWDLIWYNTGVVVTTTTAQAISMPGTSKPARDLNGATNGEGWSAAIYVTGATTNAGAITNTTISYTNESGVSGRTATIASFPATAVAGTLVLFQLAAGDRGIRSIESITLGTSYGGGSISLLLIRKLAEVPNLVANVGGIMNKLAASPTGVRVYNGSAIFFSYLSSATTATNISGSYTLTDR
jgi:hypothetical protein